MAYFMLHSHTLILIIQSTYELDEKCKSIHADKYIQLTKYDKKYKKKYGAVIQCVNG